MTRDEIDRVVWSGETMHVEFKSAAARPQSLAAEWNLPEPGLTESAAEFVVTLYRQDAGS